MSRDLVETPRPLAVLVLVTLAQLDGAPLPTVERRIPARYARDRCAEPVRA